MNFREQLKRDKYELGRLRLRAFLRARGFSDVTRAENRERTVLDEQSAPVGFQRGHRGKGRRRVK